MASVKKRTDGAWRARYRDDAGREHARHFPRRVDAQRWLDEVTASVITGMYVDPRAGQVTFGQYAADWSARQVWKPTTRTSFDQTIRQMPFLELQIGAVRRSHIEAWVKAMSETLAPSTTKLRTDHAAMVFRSAVRDRIVAANPTDGIVLPRRRRRAQAMEVPSPPQVRALMDAAEDHYKPFLALCAFAGLRLGEACGVRLEDVDFLGRQLHVRRQVQRGGDVRAPKFESERTIHLPEQLVLLLSEHVRFGIHPDGWLFVGQRGPVGDHWAQYLFRKARAAAGLSGITLHDLRHFYASGLIAAGCDVVTVQRALGHSSATTTLAVYAHLWPSAEDKTRAAAADIMAEVAGSADSLRTEGVIRAAD